jgi:hypothetical protein
MSTVVPVEIYIDVTLWWSVTQHMISISKDYWHSRSRLLSDVLHEARKQLQ